MDTPPGAVKKEKLQDWLLNYATNQKPATSTIGDPPSIRLLSPLQPYLDSSISFLSRYRSSIHP